MRKLKFILSLLMVSSCLALFGSCATEVIVRRPPPPVYIVPGPPPFVGAIWVVGEYRWNGGTYVEVPGRWIRPPRPGYAWMRGHWQPYHRGYRWIGGRWAYRY